MGQIFIAVTLYLLQHGTREIISTFFKALLPEILFNFLELDLSI